MKSCGYCYNGIVVIQRRKPSGEFAEEAAACTCDAGKQYPCYPQIAAIMPDFPYGFEKIRG